MVLSDSEWQRRFSMAREIFLRGDGFAGIQDEMNISYQSAVYYLFGCRGPKDFNSRQNSERGRYDRLVTENLDKIPGFGYELEEALYKQMPAKLVLSADEIEDLDGGEAIEDLKRDYREGLANIVEIIGCPLTEHGFIVDYDTGVVRIYPYTLQSKALIEAVGRQVLSAEVIEKAG